MKRERKELAVGECAALACEIFRNAGGQFNEEKHELLFDEQTGLWSIYHRRRRNDRSIKRAVTRVARAPYTHGYGHDRRPVVITLHPHELIETRLKGTRRRHTITWDELHRYLVRRDALNAMNAKRAERKARRAKRS
jgi:hypothetical protein